MVEHTPASQDAHTRQPDLNGRRAVITGGTTGIDRAIAVLLASSGVKVFVCDRRPEHLEDALESIRKVPGFRGPAHAGLGHSGLG